MKNDFLKMGVFLARIKRKHLLIWVGLACAWASLFRWIDPLPREMKAGDLYFDFNSQGKGQVFTFILGNLGLLFAFAATLGILLNRKTASAWLARIPFSKAAFFWVPVLVIALFGALLFVLFSQGWIYFYELSAYPISVLCFCFPLLTFAIVRSTRGAMRGVLKALLTIFACVLLLTLLFVGLIKSGASLYRPLWIPTYANLLEVLFAGMAIWILFIFDREKESFSKRKLAPPLIGLVTLVGFGYAQWRLDAEDPAIARLRELRVEYMPFSDACAQMKKQWDSVTQGSKANEALKTREEWSQAIRTIRMYPFEFEASQKIRDLLSGVIRPRAAFIGEMFAFKTCNPLLMWEVGRKITSSLEASYLTSEERTDAKKMLREILSSGVRNANTLLDVATSVLLAEWLVEHRVLNQAMLPELSRLQESIRELREDLRKTQGFDTNLIIFAQRTQQQILETLCTEVVRSGEIVDRLSAIVARQ